MTSSAPLQITALGGRPFYIEGAWQVLPGETLHGQRAQACLLHICYLHKQFRDPMCHRAEKQSLQANLCVNACHRAKFCMHRSHAGGSVDPASQD